MANVIIEDNSTKFDDIPVGSIFKYGASVYIKLEHFITLGHEDYNAANLTNGELFLLFGTEGVRVARETVVKV